MFTNLIYTYFDLDQKSPPSFGETTTCQYVTERGLGKVGMWELQEQRWIGPPTRWSFQVARKRGNLILSQLIGGKI